MRSNIGKHALLGNKYAAELSIGTRKVFFRILIYYLSTLHFAVAIGDRAAPVVLPEGPGLRPFSP